MKFAISCLLLSCVLSPFASLSGSESSRKEYLELVTEHPFLVHPTGDASRGEIQILLDEESMERIEKATGRDVGIMKKDPYWLWVNDACRFPNGKEGVYGRMLWIRSLSPVPAVAVMPVLPNGKIALNCNFRHATRGWEIELPRGLVDPQEKPEDTARREAKEETGMIVGSVDLLGAMPTDNGMVSIAVPIFAAQVLSQGEQETEDSEAIEEIVALTLDEIREAFQQGVYPMEIRGEKKQAFFRDPFLAYALTLYSPKEARPCGHSN